MSKESWRELYEKFQTPLEKLQFLNGLSELSWDDCQDAWFESNKLMPQIAAQLSAAEKENEVLQERLKELRYSVSACANGHSWIPGGVVCPFCERDSLKAKLAVAVGALETINDNSWYLNGFVPEESEQNRHYILVDRINAVRTVSTEALKAINGGDTE
jgi:septal ring factor EnvC (AmiA/AmiB activator)